jgi:TatD DNase family protein
MLYDTHAHLGYPDFTDDLAQVIERAQTAGVTKIITIGTDLESSTRAIQIAESFPCVFAAVGWHPSDASSAPEDVRPVLRPLAHHPKVVAIGEAGLDYHRLPSKQSGGTPEDDQRYKAKQLVVFQQQLELAAELGLNCVVHQRDCFEDTLRAVQEYAGRVRTVFHCFANPVDDMQRVLATDGLVSFTGIVTFKNAALIRETAQAVPADRFMLETDCPFLAPMPFRGKRCEPAYLRHTAEGISQVRGLTLEELGELTCRTADAFFRCNQFR